MLIPAHFWAKGFSRSAVSQWSAGGVREGVAGGRGVHSSTPLPTRHDNSAKAPSGRRAGFYIKTYCWSARLPYSALPHFIRSLTPTTGKRHNDLTPSTPKPEGRAKNPPALQNRKFTRPPRKPAILKQAPQNRNFGNCTSPIHRGLTPSIKNRISIVLFIK